MGIIIAVGLVTSFIILIYLSWVGASREGVNIEKVLDIIIISFVISILVARGLFILANIDEYTSFGWSVFPFYLYEGERVWFKVLPWRFFRFDEGMAFVSVVLSFLALVIAIPAILKKSIAPYVRVIFPAFTVAMFILIFSVLLNAVYVGVVQVADIAWLLLVFIVLFIILTLVYIFSEVKKRRYCVSVYLLLLSFMLLVIGFSGLLADASLYKSNLIAYTLVVVSIVVCLYSWLLDRKSDKERSREETFISNHGIADRTRRTASTRFSMTYTHIHRSESKVRSIWESFITRYHSIIRRRDVNDKG